MGTIERNDARGTRHPVVHPTPGFRRPRKTRSRRKQKAIDEMLLILARDYQFGHHHASGCHIDPKTHCDLHAVIDGIRAIEGKGPLERKGYQSP